MIDPKTTTKHNHRKAIIGTNHRNQPKQPGSAPVTTIVSGMLHNPISTVNSVHSALPAELTQSSTTLTNGELQLDDLTGGDRNLELNFTGRLFLEIMGLFGDFPVIAETFDYIN